MKSKAAEMKRNFLFVYAMFDVNCFDTIYVYRLSTILPIDVQAIVPDLLVVILRIWKYVHLSYKREGFLNSRNFTNTEKTNS